MRAAVVEGRWEVPERFNFGRDVVEAFALENRERPAITHVDPVGVLRRLTFHDVALGASRWSGLLSARGVRRGDRVLVVVGKTPAWHQVLLGALRLGAIAVPCPELLRAKDLAYRARHSEAVLIVAERDAEAELTGMAGLLGAALPVIYLDDAAPLILDQRPLACTDTHSEEAAFILYTSGTTKEPRGVVHTHGYTFAKRMQAEYWLDARPGDLVWCTAATGWAKSIWNVLLGPWSCGAEIVLHGGGFDPRERFELLARLSVDVLCQAPTEYRLMAKLDEIEQFDLRRLRHAVSAGEPLNPEVIQRFRDAFGITIYDGYGQTENTLVVANTPALATRLGSMGRPTPGHDVAVIDEHGRPVEPGVEGDIALRGGTPTLFAGYLGEPEATAAAFRGDWYVTGDRATRDRDGYFWFTGRADDVILSAAYRIGPFEVESALLEHPAVTESAAVGKPDPDRGQIVKAFVVLRPGVAPSDGLAAELQDHCKRVTAPYKYPREIEFVESLPKTRSGKIRRVELRELEAERAGQRQRAAGVARVDSPSELAPSRVAASLPTAMLELPPAKLAESETVLPPVMPEHVEPEPEPESEPQPEPEPTVPAFEPWPEPSSPVPTTLVPTTQVPTTLVPITLVPITQVPDGPLPESAPGPTPEPEEEPEPELIQEPKPTPTLAPVGGSSLVARLRAYERHSDGDGDLPDDPPFAHRFDRPRPDDDDEDEKGA